MPLYIINSIGIAYYQNEVLYIIKPTVFLYTPKGVMRYKCDLSHLMIYTLTRDDMPSLSAWIKKLSFKRTRVFWLPLLGSNQRPCG